MAKTVQDLARQKEIDEVQEEIRKTIQKIEESFSKKPEKVEEEEA
jgi:hypothetical protein